jgi:hypothetical protein
MNKLVIILLAFLILGNTSCKKGVQEAPTSYTMVIVNSAIGLSAVQVNPTGNSKITYSTTPQVTFGARGIYYVNTGEPISIVATSDTTISLIKRSFDFTSGWYSMFITGQSPALDTIIKAETDLPFIRNDITNPTSDSIVNVRFINLSPNSVPVKIKIASSTGNEVNSLPYKSISAWKAYTALAATTNYSLQIRDAITDALLASYTFTANATNRFKNVTLAIKGLQGTTTGTNAFGVFAVNYF